MGLRFQRRMSDHEINATSRRWQHLIAPQQSGRRLDGADASASKIDDEAILRRVRWTPIVRQPEPSSKV
jgi:hypothetical protein